MTKNRHAVYKILFFFGGMYIVAAAKVFLILAGFGVDPWTVFHIGISYHVPLTVGQVTQIIGAIALIIGLLLKIKPQFGTILNMYFYGLFLDINLGLNIVKPPTSIVMQILYLFMGIVISGIGLGLYINGQMGAGPRDVFMLGLSKMTGKTPGLIRTYMETSVALLGWLLKGPVGICTVAYAVLVGAVMQWTLDNVKIPSITKTKTRS